MKIDKIDIYNYQEIIKPLDCELYQIFERRDLITGSLDHYSRRPYEIVVALPASMGERAVMTSMYYEEIPAEKEFFNDVISELKDWIKEDNFLTAGIYCPTAYDEERIKIIKKVLRNNKKFKLEKTED